jgi:hypothetical protein
MLRGTPQEMQNLQFKFSLVKQGGNFFSRRAKKFISQRGKTDGKSLDFASQVVLFSLGRGNMTGFGLFSPH